ncbi:Flp pilus assembly protein CpaB [Thiomicrorhabdus sp.]|uniref:Flp pilus assembly protein CpaB n=1 Tax=Thiomicrorhabdus sp. TaxID=2039724 RepID=UPI0029C8D330|nr:Flp pilus assembly protein CpaB [Thiomicrorhabdus sp.]
MKILRSDFILYGIAALAAVLAVVLVYGYVEKRVSEVESKEIIKTVTVVQKPELLPIVAVNRDIHRGERLVETDLTILQVPKEGIQVAGSLRDIKQAVGHVAQQAMFKGEWLLTSKIGTQDPDAKDTKDAKAQRSSEVEALLTGGMRAMRIQVTAESGLLGILNPGDHVDVISVFEVKDGAKSKVLSRNILQNIEVLTVGRYNRMQKRETVSEKTGKDSEAAEKISMVALNVNVEQAERLALALSVGKVHLALRSSADAKVVNSRGVDIRDMQKVVLKDPNQSPDEIKPVKPKVVRHTIEVLEGDEVKKVVVR